jgi:hypothetical protein
MHVGVNGLGAPSVAAGQLAGVTGDDEAKRRRQLLQSAIGGVIKLLERKSELATLRALARRGGVLVVEGRAGVGKTAILDAACAIGRRDAPRSSPPSVANGLRQGSTS